MMESMLSKMFGFLIESTFSQSAQCSFKFSQVLSCGRTTYSPACISFNLTRMKRKSGRRSGSSSQQDVMQFKILSPQWRRSVTGRRSVIRPFTNSGCATRSMISVNFNKRVTARLKFPSSGHTKSRHSLQALPIVRSCVFPQGPARPINS